MLAIRTIRRDGMSWCADVSAGDDIEERCCISHTTSDDKFTGQTTQWIAIVWAGRDAVTGRFKSHEPITRSGNTNRTTAIVRMRKRDDACCDRSP